MSSSQLDRALVMEAVRVTEAAAIAAWKHRGLGDERAADEAATAAMHVSLGELNIDGRIVIGEGEKGEAPCLYTGEAVGNGKGPRVDIALDPLEGTTLTAKAMANAMTVMAWAPEGALMNVPDTYMEKLACGPGYPPGILDLDKSAAENVTALAAFKGVAPSALTACVLDRPRHYGIIDSLRSVGARVSLISDGDVAGVIFTADPDTGIDLYVGQGGAPEGVLACAALKCVGGQFLGRLVLKSADDKAKASRLGITDFDRVYALDDIVRADAIFAATGVTSGALLDGVYKRNGFVHAHSLVMFSATGAIREIRLKRPA